MCDILWSDPIENFGQERGTGEFCAQPRAGMLLLLYTYIGCVRLPGAEIASLSIIRAHEAQDDGFDQNLNHFKKWCALTPNDVYRYRMYRKGP